jgi:hypothetical protein
MSNYKDKREYYLKLKKHDNLTEHQQKLILHKIKKYTKLIGGAPDDSSLRPSKTGNYNLMAIDKKKRIFLLREYERMVEINKYRIDEIQRRADESKKIYQQENIELKRKKTDILNRYFMRDKLIAYRALKRNPNKLQEIKDEIIAEDEGRLDGFMDAFSANDDDDFE